MPVYTKEWIKFEEVLGVFKNVKQENKLQYVV